ncbi:serine/threonine-protein kinase [Paenibacillus sp. NEAU-GSW1]|uniref:serine/threonine-protein kinase n=1 Tax=Paenibacillus sp. NEAU-GSW1 TaxID=2682486 RepID=UPI0015641806|nr:serine/threonine-protein kinase [Paenibacillus sp. NEAU-GSW1]
MHDLAFSKSYNYMFKRTVYSNENTQSWFYEAFDDTDKRTVGVKKVHVQYKDLARAQAEANVIHTLSNVTTQIPALYNTHYDRANEMYYLIMQYIDGGVTLRKYMESSLPVDAAIDTMIKICDVLLQLHKKRFQHRDLKPENIMVKDNQVFIIDFNISTSVPFKGEGTDLYRAPEQTEGMRQIGLNAIDMFSLGVILYEFVTGKPPVRGEDYSYRRGADEWKFFVSAIDKRPELSPELNDVIMTCLKLNPLHRFKDMWQLKQALLQTKRGMRASGGAQQRNHSY